MSLKKYFKKRDFSVSGEPKGGQKRKAALSFCVQKHQARRLHYDFRLEHRGVLISWAVPKGPSLDPSDKRLAVHVEDHPLDYQYFEGTIPKGHYGAGTVEIWDRGSYTPYSEGQESPDKIIARGMKEGHLAIELKGKKLHGRFILQKLKKGDPEDPNWLLIKQSDSESENEGLKERAQKKNRGKKSAMPESIAPMLATLVKEPFNSSDWLFEVKWDGYRALARIDRGKVKLKSRSGKLWNENFRSIVKELEKIKERVILDGELVILDKEGKSSFQLMQNYQGASEGNLFYYLFDLLYEDGFDLRDLSLIERKKRLEELVKAWKLPHVRLSSHILERGVDFFKEASKASLEGIIGKKIASTYQSRRSSEWVKIKTGMRQEVVIAGFTSPRGSRKNFGALVVGLYDKKGNFHYAGHVGGGFSQTSLKEVYSQLKKRTTKKSPFTEEIKTNEKVVWVKPELVAEVAFTEWTREGSMRHPIFQGLRVDKNPKSIEKEKPVDKPPKSQKMAKISTKRLNLTNLDKVFWPNEGYTKGDLINYYMQVADAMLPYLKDRPIMLHRFPEGIEGFDFYQKNQELAPEWLKTFPLRQEGKLIHYLLIANKEALLWAVNAASIDIHPFLARTKNLENPDFCVIDLDPHGIAFSKVIEAARVTSELLDEIGIEHFFKTSGGKGLHILIPLKAKYSFQQSRSLAEIIASCVHQRLKKTTSLERDPSKRKKKVYLDCLQNRIAQTLVAPYSVRPRPGACVSAPLSIDEIKADLDVRDFTIQTMPKRLQEKGDLLKPLLTTSINLKTLLPKLKKMMPI